VILQDIPKEIGTYSIRVKAEGRGINDVCESTVKVAE